MLNKPSCNPTENLQFRLDSELIKPRPLLADFQNCRFVWPCRFRQGCKETVMGGSGQGTRTAATSRANRVAPIRACCNAHWSKSLCIHAPPRYRLARARGGICLNQTTPSRSSGLYPVESTRAGWPPVPCLPAVVTLPVLSYSVRMWSRSPHPDGSRQRFFRFCIVAEGTQLSPIFILGTRLGACPRSAIFCPVGNFLPENSHPPFCLKAGLTRVYRFLLHNLRAYLFAIDWHHNCLKDFLPITVQIVRIT